MTRVDFYILSGSEDDLLYRLACRLVDKACKRKMRCFINVADAGAASALDDLLWTFRDTSFLTHARSGDATDTAQVAAVIGVNDEPAAEYDLLINLGADVPAYFSRFERVAELIDSEPARRASGRERFRFYRDRGYPLDTHNIS